MNGSLLVSKRKWDSRGQQITMEGEGSKGKGGRVGWRVEEVKVQDSYGVPGGGGGGGGGGVPGETQVKIRHVLGT